MSNARTTLVTIATYNEIENLPRLIEEIFAEVPQVDVLVIDDNSPDGTGAWCLQRAAEDPRVRCLSRQSKGGLGSAIVAGMQYAIEHGYRYVVNLDADLSHSPRHLRDLLAGMEPVAGPPIDVMIGSRYAPGGGIEGWPIRRYLMSRAVNLYARCLLGLSPKDCSGSYRCYRTERLAQLDFSRIRSRGYSFFEEILWQLKRLGARFGETPITFVERQFGRSKIDLREALTAIAIIARLGLKNWLRI
jgi:dolichol-phosphate mannosyltransferase